MEKEELIKKYDLDLEKLEKEQEKLSKELVIKSKFDLTLLQSFAAIDNSFIGKKILSSIIICDKEYETLDNVYSIEKLSFPYIPGFRAYRELPAMVLAFNKLKQKPDIVFIKGQGITHTRLGLASHFSLVTGVASIGISDSAVGCTIRGEDIYKDTKKVGKILITKPGSRPLYISPGNLISIDDAYELVKSMTKLPHKLPEPLVLASKYSKKIINEFFKESSPEKN